jgi:hypothetical protein
MPAPVGPVSLFLRYRRLIAVLAGAATSFAFAPYNLYFLAFVGPAVLFLLWEYEQPREAAGTAFWFGAALFGAGTWWIFTAVHEFGQAPVWLATALVVALLAIKGGYYALLAVHRLSVASARLFAVRRSARGAGDRRRHPLRHVRRRRHGRRNRRGLLPGRSGTHRRHRAVRDPLALRLAARRGRMDAPGRRPGRCRPPAGGNPARREMARREPRIHA